MVVKVAQSGGTANYSDIAAGVVYAAQKGARVINLSLGGTSDSVTLRTAIAQAAQTATIVAGVGNSDSTTKIYPAAYDDHVIAVAGTGRADAKVATSNYGPWVDLAAPGEEITTTFPGGTWGVTSGTSMAAPFVAGVAGLVRSHQPAWSPTSTRQQLLNTADDIDAANTALGTGQLGRGRVNAYAALTTAAAPLLAVAGTSVNGLAGGTVKLGVEVPVVVTLRNGWLDATSVTGTLSTTDAAVTIGKATASFGAIVGGATGDNAEDAFEVTVAVGSGYGRSIALTLTLTADGQQTTLPVTLASEATTVTVSGAISTNTTWRSDRVYRVTGNVIVNQGVSLSIEAGTTVRIDAGKVIVVNGTLVANGTAERRIVFTRSSDGTYWGSQGPGTTGGGLRFNPSASPTRRDQDGNYEGGCLLRHVVVEFGYGVSVLETPLWVDRSVFRHNNGPLAFGNSRGSLVTGSQFLDNDAEAIFSGLDELTVRGSLFSSNAGAIAIVGSGRRIVEGNTFVGNDPLTSTDKAAVIMFYAGAAVAIHGNNFVGNHGEWDLAVVNNTGQSPIDVSGNYWRGATSEAIQARIFDFADDVNLPMIEPQPLLDEPAAGAPSVVNHLTLSPSSPVGIQTVAFRATFSGPMDATHQPELSFKPVHSSTPIVYTPASSALPAVNFAWLGVDNQGVLWAVGTDLRSQHKLVRIAEDGLRVFDYSTVFPWSGSAYGFAIDSRDRKWVVGSTNGISTIAVLDGDTWHPLTCGTQSFDCRNASIATASPAGAVFLLHLPGHLEMVSVLNDGEWSRILPAAGERWFTCDAESDSAGGLWLAEDNVVRRYSNGVWSTFSFPSNGRCISLAAGEDGAMWAAVGLTLMNLAVTPHVVLQLPDNATPMGSGIEGIAASGGELAAVSRGRLYRFRDGVWTSPAALGERNIALDPAGNLWVASALNQGISKYLPDRVIKPSPGRWLDDRTYEASYDFTSLVPRGEYVLTVSGARDQLGFDTPAATTTFTVDYAGTITDRTPPAAPAVIAAGRTGQLGGVEARWAAPSTAGVLTSGQLAAAAAASVTGYRYAIGTAAGATDVVNWTDTSATSVSLSNLGLLAGQQYYFTLQARNEGGLWSPATITPFVAGEGFRTAYLAEGATGSFFDLDIAIANPGTDPAAAAVTFLMEGGGTESLTYLLAPQSRLTLRADQVPGLDVGQVAVSTVVESSRPLVVERTMFWDETRYYGGHGGAAVNGPSRTWYFAEGFQGYFDTWLLLANAGDTAATATVRFLRESGTPVVDVLQVAPHARLNVYAGSYPPLSDRGFSIVVDSDVPIIAERAMYFGSSPQWAATSRPACPRRRRGGRCPRGRRARTSTATSSSPTPTTRPSPSPSRSCSVASTRARRTRRR